VRARDTNLADSGYSLRDVASLRVFTDATINPSNVNGGTRIKAVHVSELRQAIDAVRIAAGMGAAWSSYVPTGVVDDAHFTEMADRLNEARTSFTLDAVALTDVIAHGWKVRPNTIHELREGVK
jgi:hypothetical protein